MRTNIHIDNQLMADAMEACGVTILDAVPLLYSDRDFDPFVAHFGLRLMLDATGVT